MSRLRTTVEALSAAKGALYAAIVDLWAVRVELRDPSMLFDPEPATPVTSLASFPSGGVWTPRMDDVTSQVYMLASMLELVGKQALRDERDLFIDPAGNFYVEGFSGDPWSLQVVSPGVIAFLNPATGVFLSGIDTQGNALSAAQVQAASAASVGTAGVYSISGIASLSVIGTAGFFVVEELCRQATMAAMDATDADIARCAQGGTCDPGTLAALKQGQLARSQAAVKTVPRSVSAGQMLKWGAIGGAAVAAALFAFGREAA